MMKLDQYLNKGNLHRIGYRVKKTNATDPGSLKRVITLTLLLILVGLMTMGCAASKGDNPDDQPSIVEGEGNYNEIGETLQDKTQDGSLPPTDSEPSDTTTDPQGHNDVNDGSKNQSSQGNQANQKPVSAPKQSTEKMKSILKCTFSINCSTVFDNLNKIDSAIVETLPQDGWIYKATEVEFTEGESVFDILLRVTRQEKIHMESNSNPALKSKYVEGIHNLYEFDAGELSGWTYKINGKGMGYGSSSSYPKDGDVIEWIYTCDQGRDIGVTAQ